ncbi:hypothetical protein BZA05DRAFT_421397 [Tricharina praecox]|uniref:uncharacterized protein n=1 Tax=Tricharina praecox TaxID=43433 RepID=UPI00221ECCAA|nr:uncharacterized protein BZA05DRAFT_421397 [Tricharina praecox]KAI5845318.1 hypothetical protein BZA05DRAFT_421397 [Tricharina praecox]
MCLIPDFFTPLTPSRRLGSASVYSSAPAGQVYAQLHRHHSAKGHYDVAIRRVEQLWGRQWRCDVLKVSVKHVTEVWKKDRMVLETLYPTAVCQYFYARLDLATMKKIFKCIGTEVDLNDIFNSPAAELYSTFYCNICDYVLQHCVKPGSNRTKHDDDQLYDSCRLIAREEKFDHLDVDDIPVLPMKPFSPVHSHSKRVHGSRGGEEEMGEMDPREEEEEEDRREGEEGDQPTSVTLDSPPPRQPTSVAHESSTSTTSLQLTLDSPPPWACLYHPRVEHLYLEDLHPTHLHPKHLHPEYD